MCVVLAYHQVEDLSADPVLGPYGVAPELLGAQLDALAAGGPVPAGVVVTFDDAYDSVRTDGLGVLRARGVPATIFVVCGRIGETNGWSARPGRGELALMDAGALRAAAGQGVTIGAHTVSHRRLTGLGDCELEEELTGSRDELERLGLGRARALAYPYGDHDERVRRAAAAAGYEAAFTIEPGPLTPASDRFALPRIEVRATHMPAMLLDRVAIALRNGVGREDPRGSG